MQMNDIRWGVILLDEARNGRAKKSKLSGIGCEGAIWGIVAIYFVWSIRRKQWMFDRQMSDTGVRARYLPYCGRMLGSGEVYVDGAYVLCFW